MNELEEIRAAQAVIEGKLHRTPLMRSSYLGDSLGVRLDFKMEMFQKTGSFKIRGVLNKLASLSVEEKSRGVIGMSSGNHAQALAYGASLEGVAATIVMPAYSVAGKIDATKAYGGEVHVTAENLIAACERIREERGLALVHPFDDPKIIAGAGTLGLEILEDAPDVDSIFVSVGGGGLVSGVATAAKLSRPGVKVIGVEPEGACAMTKSLTEGKPVHLEKVETVADGLAAPFSGRHTLDRVQRYVDEIVLVSDEEILEAMRLIIERCKVVPEPSAAASFAALRPGRAKTPLGRRVVCVLSGGNIDCARLKTLL